MKTIIRNGEIFDGIHDEVLKNKIIEIEDNYITYVGDPRDYDSSWTILDAEGGFIMPGLIDAHMHMSGIIDGDTYPRILEPNLQQAMVSVKEAEQTLACGFTTVCETSIVGAYLKRVISKGIVKGPRLLPTGQGMTAGFNPTIDPDGILPFDYLTSNHPWAQQCSGTDNLRFAIRELDRIGCEAVKIWATGGGCNERPKNTDKIYSDDELLAVVDEAKSKGMPIIAHCESKQGTIQALNCGIRNILHGTEIDDECISLMIEKNAYLMPTLKVNLDWVDYYTDQELKARAGLSDYPGETLQQKEYNRVIATFKQAVESGVKVALASDTYCEETPYGFYGLEEIKKFVDPCGMAASQALLAATRNAAEVLELDDRIGTLEQGKFADLLILSKNAIEDINALSKENILYVIKDGAVIE